MLRRLRTSIEGSTDRLAIAILAGCALLAFSPWATADSTPRRQARSTHVGVAPSDFVVLSTFDDGSSTDFRRVDAVGNRAATEFDVPDGQVLVVTDVDWSGDCGQAGDEPTLRLYVENVQTPTTRSIVFLQHQLINDGSSGSAGGGGASSIASGFIVRTGGRLTADLVRSNDRVGTQAFDSRTSDVTVVVRGYLVRDE